MKLSHFLAQALQHLGVTHVFGVQGGAVVHLFDSLHTQTKIKVCYTHHEQSAALAAVSHSKLTGRLGICITTTGPAASNALTGLLAAWQDSTPVLFISGQTRLSQTSYGLKVRQKGSQECNILDVVKPWAKYTALVRHQSELTSIINKAYFMAIEGRPGPVWIDLPVDLQWSDLDTATEYIVPDIKSNLDWKNHMDPVFDAIFSSKKPLFVLGRISYNKDIIKKFLSNLKYLEIPIASTWGSATISKGVCTSSGMIGVSGQPSANYSVRASDYVVFLGCHFSVTQSGNSYKPLTDNQAFVFVNIDSNELNNVECPVHATMLNIDANIFMQKFLDYVKVNEFSLLSENRKPWVEHIEFISESLAPHAAAELLTDDEWLNPHHFLCSLYSRLEQNDLVVIDGGGCALYAGFQCLPRDAHFLVACSTSISAMGTGLPDLCGAAIANNAESLNICLIGDGSLMFNLQELQTIKTNLDSSVILVLNNSGYLAIRHTQGLFLGNRYFGTSGNDYGIDIPPISAIANCFNYDHIALTRNDQVDICVDKIIASRGCKNHLIIELVVSPDHANLFTASFSKVDDDNNSFQQDLHLMKPFEAFDYNSPLGL